MRLALHPTRPGIWQVFDDDGMLAALGHLEVQVVPVAPFALGEVMFVPDWSRAVPHEQETHTRKNTVIGR